MRAFSSTLLEELRKEVFSIFWLVELDFSTVQRFIDIDIDIYYGGYRYLSYPFKVGDITYTADMAIDSVVLEIANVDLSMSALLFGSDITGSEATISFGCFNPTGELGGGSGGGLGEGDSEFVTDDAIFVTDDAEFITTESAESGGSGGSLIFGVTNIFVGRISGWKVLRDKSVELTIVNEFMLWRKKTLRIAQSSCPWPFEGVECTYAGVEVWCDQTYERCFILNNKDSFGGFRFLPYIMEKTIWWGGPKPTD